MSKWQKHQPDTDTVEFQRELHQVCRARSRLVVCFYTLPLYIAALVLLLNEGRSVVMFMFVYMAVYAVFAIDMVVKKCPACSKQFYVTAFFLNFITKKCVHCGLSCTGNRRNQQEPGGREF